MQVREGFVVILANHNYSYGKWDKIGIPCEHALVVILFNGVWPNGLKKTLIVRLATPLPI